jgi:hypothetical protein
VNSLRPYVIGDTRTEQGFARFLGTLLSSAAANTRWDIVCDNLNIHLSESVVRPVARHCGFDGDLASKVGPACSLQGQPAKHFSVRETIASSSTSPPSTHHGSNRSKARR